MFPCEMVSSHGLVSGSGEERARIGNRSANTSIRNRRRSIRNRCRSIRKKTGSSIRVRSTSVHGRAPGLKWQDRQGRLRPMRWLE